MTDAHTALAANGALRTHNPALRGEFHDVRLPMTACSIPMHCAKAGATRLTSGLHFSHRRLIMQRHALARLDRKRPRGARRLQYNFDGYAFDTGTRELRRGAELVSIAPQVFDLLSYLIRNRDRVVTKDELIDAIWNGRAVSDAAVTTRLNVARSAIGDSGNEQRLIRTLPRRGFRFVAPMK
ncbi:winged helix-turn-helix domain-containing protein [Bradyrhizobium ivorense]|uniref:winged helix-turn-helix domain-containing protein n=1 Tax=Bradyrhizobium ivorense TaxID=2511166 RepID=UPI0032220DF3